MVVKEEEEEEEHAPPCCCCCVPIHPNTIISKQQQSLPSLPTSRCGCVEELYVVVVEMEMEFGAKGEGVVLFKGE